jgi:hypothetical protein
MNNVHPLFREALAPFAPAPVKVSPALRPFEVSIRIDGKPQTINVLAFTSCDAICNAIDMFFDGDEPMPADGLEVFARPMNFLPSAA